MSHMKLPPHQERSDEQLLFGGARGDRLSISELYDRHGRAAYRCASSICLEPVRAAGAVIAAFTATDGRGPVPQGTVGSWLALRASRHARRAERDGGTVLEGLARLPELASLSIALTRGADLSCRQIATELDLEEPAVRRAMREGLHDLAC